jgi:branched-chain amino acid transport system substrate-binding protein
MDCQLQVRPLAAYGEPMKLPPVLCAILCCTLPAQAQEPLRIGLSLPLSGPYKLLGEQAKAGAEAAVAALAGARAVELIVADDQCTNEGGKSAAAQFAAAKAEAVAGFLCTPPLSAATSAFAATAMPLVTIGVRAGAATGKSANAASHVFRLAPASGQELDAVAKLLLPLWRGKKFAIVDDGTLRSRELAESLRVAAEAEGLKPVLIDTLRPGQEDQLPLVSRLKKAGATHAFVGGDREDIAVIAQDAAQKDYKLTLAGSEALNAAPLDHALPDGVLMIGVEPADRLEEAKSAVSAASAAKIAPEGYFLPAYAAVQLIAEAAAVNGKPLNQAIRETPHKTVLGAIRFAPNGDLIDNPYSVLVSRAGAFEVYQQ